MTTLLIIDDDLPLVQTLVEAFEAEDYQVVSAFDGRAGIEAALNTQPDLILLEITLPKLNGYSVCREIRRQSSVPIIVLSSLQDELHRVASLEMGANDFVGKPVSIGELMARVRSQLRWRGEVQSQISVPTSQEQLLEVGSLRVYPLKHEAWRNEHQLELTSKQFALLVYLIQNSGIVFSRSHLMDQIWPQSYVSGPRTVDVHIHELREKIEDDPARPLLIQTVRGVGYRFQMPRNRSVSGD